MADTSRPTPGQFAQKRGPQTEKPGDPQVAYAEAIAHFIENAGDLLEHDGKRFVRFTEDEVVHGRNLMRSYFFTRDVGEEHPRIANAVRFGFALVCLKYRLRGLPGQQRAWYTTYQHRAQRFLRSREEPPAHS